MAEIKPRKIHKARSIEELPFPELGAKHEKNKLQKVFSARVSPNVKDRFDSWVDSMGLSKRQATEYALELAMEKSPD